MSSDKSKPLKTEHDVSLHQFKEYCTWLSRRAGCWNACKPTVTAVNTNKYTPLEALYAHIRLFTPCLPLMLIVKRWNRLNLGSWTSPPSTARRYHSPIAPLYSPLSDPLNCLSHLNTFKYKFRIYTNNTPPGQTWNAHFCLIPSIARRELAWKGENKGGEGTRALCYFPSCCHRSEICRPFCFIVFTGRWLFPFQGKFLSWFVITTEVPLQSKSWVFKNEVDA